jgi:hypothetical protein
MAELIHKINFRRGSRRRSSCEDLKWCKARRRDAFKGGKQKRTLSVTKRSERDVTVILNVTSLWSRAHFFNVLVNKPMSSLLCMRWFTYVRGKITLKCTLHMHRRTIPFYKPRLKLSFFCKKGSLWKFLKVVAEKATFWPSKCIKDKQLSKGNWSLDWSSSSPRHQTNREYVKFFAPKMCVAGGCKILM